ncbi:MAG: phosphate-starvation-inducible PsiE family protein [Cyanobacteria bacterium P01_A01_bin.3]
MAQKWARWITKQLEAESFLYALETLELGVSRVLALIVVVVVISATANLAWTIAVELFRPPFGIFRTSLIVIFGLILDVLIAMELLENIAVYLKRSVLQVELVLATALIAISRKIIILDFPNTPALKLVGLAAAIAALSLSYWLVRRSSQELLNKE